VKGDTDVGGKTVLKLILEWAVRMWTGFILFKIASLNPVMNVRVSKRDECFFFQPASDCQLLEV
jgi:hypothetical protein